MAVVPRVRQQSATFFTFQREQREALAASVLRLKKAVMVCA